MTNKEIYDSRKLKYNLNFIALHSIEKGDHITWGGLVLTVPGPILIVKNYTLQTASVVFDALLGQGEALDCFNNKTQDAAVIAENVKNLEMLQRLEVLEELGDPNTKATLYKKIFGACCDTPQTQIIH